jgi:hypothetical protein
MNKISDNKHVLLLIKIKFEENQIRTLNDLQTINTNSKGELLQFFKDKLQILNEAYKVIPISSLIFSYGIRDGEISPKINNPALTQKTPSNIKYQIYYKNELPLAKIPEDYGTILSKIDNNYTILVNRGVHNALINLTVKSIKNKIINHIRYIKYNILLFSWTDTVISLENKKFIRNIGKSIIHYENGEISLYTTIKKTKPMVSKILSKNKQLTNKFITMDIETIIYNNILIPYLLCWYDGEIKKHYYITHPSEIESYISSNEGDVESSVSALILDAMTDISKRKYKGYKIYFHNFAKFDGYFLIRFLGQLGKCEPLIHKGKIISTKFRLYESKYSFIFMDSLLITFFFKRSLYFI